MNVQTICARGTARDWERIDPSGADPVRIAVVGLGQFTQNWVLPALKESRFCELSVLVAESSPGVAKRNIEAPNSVSAVSYDAFRDGAVADEFDAAYICTPNGLHLDHCRAAAKNGKAILCEKPIERSSDRGESLVRACEDVPLMIGYRMQTEPSTRRMRELIRAGAIGDIRSVHAHMSQRLLVDVDSDFDQWRLDPNISGGGALVDLGVYPINTTRFLLDSDPISVSGRTTSSHEAFSSVDESASFTVEFDEALLAQCFVSHNCQRSSGIEIVGSEGRIALQPAFFQDQDKTLTIETPNFEAELDFDGANQMSEEFDFFAQCVMTGDRVPADGKHALVDLLTIEAIYRSAAERTWISV